MAQDLRAPVAGKRFGHEFLKGPGIQLDIITLIESLNHLKESPDYELCQLSEMKPGVLDELAAERAKMLEQERSDLEKRASRLAEEIAKLSGQAPIRIA